MAQDKFYATGKRKTAIAKVWLTPGSGKILLVGDACGFDRDVLSRAERTERDNGRHMVRAVALLGIGNQLFAPVIVLAITLASWALRPPSRRLA